LAIYFPVCGIAGILRVHAPGAAVLPPQVAIPEAWLDVLDESIKHRGPDGQGRFRDRAVRPDGAVVDVALVHRRLAIIDLADGAQPMVSARDLRASGGISADGLNVPLLFQGGPRDAVRYRPLSTPTLARGARPDSDDLVAVVFNGCIYNHRELRKELQAAGHVFETDHSDTEVLVHGWREWGSGLPSRLDGMFSFALWDRSRGQLLLWRDPAGEKPLYETEVSPFAFASAPAALQRLMARLDRERLLINEPKPGIWMRGVREWLRFGGTCFNPYSGIIEVEGRAESRFERADRGDGVLVDGPVHDWYEDLPDRNGERLDVRRVEGLLTEAVRSRLVTDVPLGCFLSGGIDSSLMALLAQRESGRIRTFCVRMPDPRYDESEIAAEVAGLIGSDHSTLECSPSPADELPDLIKQLGLPFGDSSLLPTYWVSRATRQVVKVALAGDGGDELFGGYERHAINPWLQRLAPILRHMPARVGWTAHPKSFRNKLGRLVAAAHSGYAELTAIFDRADLCTLVPGAEPGLSLPGQRSDALRCDFEWYLPYDLLRKTDTASMRVALEVRAPMLSRAVVHAALRAPLGDIMPRGQRKGLLRQVARKYLPAEIVDRPKQGFAIPIGEWFRSDYGGMKQLLMDHVNSAEPWGPPSLGIDLNMKFVRQMLDEHMGTGPSGRVVRDHSQRLYMLLVLSIWAKWLGSL
jgi:asparagine synthase (glutamine-hydrolysing)